MVFARRSHQIGRLPDELVQKAVDEFGRLDIIVNNAGYTCDGVIHKMTDEQW